MKQHPIVTVLMVIFLTVGCVLAVSDQEIENMKQAMPDKPVVQPKQPRTLLVFSLCKGFNHSCIPYWKQALDIMAEKTGAFTVVHSEDMDIFNSDALKQFDAICFNNTTSLEPNSDQQKAIMDFITSGKGIIGIHAATDNFNNWPEGMMMMGGVFKGHPWTANGTWAVKIDEPDHPLMKSFEGKGFKVNDEIYRTIEPQYSRDKQRVLMSLDMSDPTTKNATGVQPNDMDTGISWIKSVGEGRLFYCSLGHNHHLTWFAPLLQHELAGIQYALGDYDVDDTPLAGPSAAKVDSEKLDSLINEVKTYDWESSRTGIYAFQRFIQEYMNDPQSLAAIEDKLLAMLNADVSAAAKDFICRELAVIGSEKSVPMLSKMLTDEATSNMARYALEKIPGKTVDQVMLAALKQVKQQDIQIGLITSLGIRQSDDAVDVLATYAKNEDSAMVSAAIGALGSIATEQAAEQLNALQDTVEGELKLLLEDARLNCANVLSQSGKTQAAQAIYKNIYSGKNPSLIRAAAMQGLIESGTPQAQTMLSAAVHDTDAVIQQTAFKILAGIDDRQTLQSIASEMPKLSDSAKIQLLGSLSQNPLKIGADQALKLMDSENPSVRMAACSALAELGDASAVEPLAKAAAQASNRDERLAAQNALYRVSGEGVNALILEKIQQAATANSDDPTALEYIKATAQRPIPEAVPLLSKIVLSDKRRLSAESIRAIQAIAGSRDVPGLIELLVAKPGDAMETLVAVVAARNPDATQRADVLMEQYSKVQDEQAKVSLLHVMGKLGDPKSVSVLKEAYTSSDKALAEAAFRGMTDWPGVEFLGQMKTIAQDDPDLKNKVLAYRTYIRMLNDSATDENQQQIADALIEAYAMAPRVEEKKLVISALGKYGNVSALEFVNEKTADEELQAEAEVALIEICEALGFRNRTTVTPVLEKLAKSQNEIVKSRAERLLSRGNRR